MELCRATLEQLIKGQYDGPPIGTDKEILLLVAKAVEYLADKGIVLRNINTKKHFCLVSGRKYSAKNKIN